MSPHRDLDPIVRSWLEEGVTALPDRVLDAVLDELPATPQRRTGWWPARRLFRMNRAVVLGLGAAAVVIVAILGFGILLPAVTSVGGPHASPTPTPGGMSWPEEGTSLAPGTYISDGPAPVHVTITVPGGWVACGTGPDAFTVCAGTTHPRGVEVMVVDNLVSDPCDRSRVMLDPPVGDSVDDLVAALSNLPGFEATDPIDITRDGFGGKELELRAPIEPGCAVDARGLGTWSRAIGINGVGPGEVNLLRILDVDGVRVMIAGAYQPPATAAEVAEIRAMLDSIHLAAP